MTATKKLLIDPKDLAAVITGVALAIALMAFFYVLSSSLGQDTFVRHSVIPYQ